MNPTSSLPGPSSLPSRRRRPTPDLIDLIEATERRDRGMALAAEAEPSAWTRAAERSITDLAATGEPFSSDDVCRIAGRPMHPNAVGALMRRAVAAGALERAGSVQSERVLARGRWLPLYRRRTV